MIYAVHVYVKRGYTSTKLKNHEKILEEHGCSWENWGQIQNKKWEPII